VFPPLFPSSKAEDSLGVEERMERFVKEVRAVRSFADLFLVADVKDTRFLKLSTIEAASILQEHLGVSAAPVIVVRDMNRPQFLSSVLTAIAKGLGSVMLAWGDDYHTAANVTNFRNFSSLAQAIEEASTISRRAGSGTRFLAPVNIAKLSGPGGVTKAKGRLKSGADLLLAQPPTTDAPETFEKHASALRENGLTEKVLLNVFPFRDESDVRQCEESFGWELPRSLRREAAAGEQSLLEAAKSVVRRLREERFPGVYLATRGDPGVAQLLLS